MTELVSYGEGDEIEGCQYERLVYAWLEIVKRRQEVRIAALATP